MPFNSDKAQARLYDFKLQELFILELGWSQPADRNPGSLEVEGQIYQRAQIVQMSGVPIFEIASPDGDIPTAEIRNAIYIIDRCSVCRESADFCQSEPDAIAVVLGEAGRNKILPPHRVVRAGATTGFVAEQDGRAAYSLGSVGAG